MTCSVEECPSPVEVKGMCSKHYQRVRRHGHPTLVTRSCRECCAEFQYEPTNGVRRFLCAPCVGRNQQARWARYNHRQSAAATVEPEFYVRLQAYRFRSNIRRYGITPSDFDAMLAAQCGLCAICGDAPDPEGRGAYARLHIDHDHTSGAVRALLCGRCNSALGLFRDDPDLLRAAAAYLESHIMEASA